MAPKKGSATILDSSSSEETAALPNFLSGAGVMSFVVVFDNWVYRFAAGRVDFLLCKDLVSFVNDYCVLGPRYVDRKSDQLWNYETHPIRAPIPVCHAEGIDWSNWNKMLPRASNTFDFGVGPMPISILNLAVIFGFRLSGLIGSTQAFGAFMGAFMNRAGFERSNHCSHQPQCEGTLVYGANLVAVDFPGIKRLRPAYHLRFGPLERSNSELGVWVRAKYEASARVLELKPYQPVCCGTLPFQAWWDNYLGRFGTIDAAHKRSFKSCPFRQNLSEDGRHALLEQIATDKKLPLTTQRKRSSRRVSVPLGPAPKTANLSRTRESRTAPFAFPYSGTKRSLSEETDQVGDTQAHPEAAQTKRARILTTEAPELASTAPYSTPIPVVGVHDAEIVVVDEMDPLPASPLREERPFELDARGILSETVVPAETKCPLGIGEGRFEETTCEEGLLEEVMIEDPTEVVIEVLAPAVESMDFERESSVPDPKETEMPKTGSMTPELTVDPMDRTEASHNSGSSRVEKSEVPTMSKERTKLILAKWVTLSMDERISKLDLLALANKFQHSDAAQFPDDDAQLEAELARSREETKAQHEELEKCELLWKQADWRLRTSEACLQQVLLQKEELQDEVDQMLMALTTAKEDIDKANMDVGLEIWQEKLRMIRLDKIHVDTRHFC
ncbi:hypothetical protein GBA52_024215 [Prunus armeniaca]|nr:hypothetical protein GBA52_024215 [Prunus armeniaca]